MDHLVQPLAFLLRIITLRKNNDEKQGKLGDRIFTLLDQLEQAVDQLIEQLKVEKNSRLDMGEQVEEAAK